MNGPESLNLSNIVVRADGLAEAEVDGEVVALDEQGRASFSMEFDHYDFVPSLQAEKVIAAAKAGKSGEEEEEE